MKKNLQKVIFITLIIGFVLACSPVYAVSDTLKGLYISAGKGYLNKDLDGNYEITEGTGLLVSIPGTIGKVIGGALSLLGVAFMLLIIYGGFTWMFARGNDQAVVKAKSIIEAAVIGLTIVLAAYAITTFIGSSF